MNLRTSLIALFSFVFVFLGITAFLPNSATAEVTCTLVYVESTGQIDSDIGGAQYSTGGSWVCIEDQSTDPSGSPAPSGTLTAGFINDSGSVYGGTKTVSPGETVRFFAKDDIVPVSSECPIITTGLGYSVSGLGATNQGTHIYAGYYDASPGSVQEWTVTAPSTPGSYSISIGSAQWFEKKSNYGGNNCNAPLTTRREVREVENTTLTVVVSPPTASLSVAPAGEEAFGGSTTVIQSDSTSNTTFRALCENSIGGLLTGPEVDNDVPDNDSTDYSTALNSVGTHSYELTCSSSSGSTPPATTEVSVTVEPAPSANSCSITSDKAEVESGGTYTLTWGGQNLMFATAQNSTPATSDWTQRGVANSGSVTVTAPVLSPGESVTYSHPLLCGYSGGARETVTASVVVFEPEVSGSIEFTNDPITVNEGEQFTLSWVSENIEGQTLSKSGAWSNPGVASNTTGSQQIQAPMVSGNTTRSYTLSGVGSDGNPVSATAVVNIVNLPRGIINVTHNGESDYASGTYSIFTGVVSNTSLASGGSDSYDVSPSSGGTSYSFVADFNSDGPYISVNGGTYMFTNSATFVVEDGDVVNVDFYYVEEPTTSSLVVTSSCPVTTTYSFSGTGTPSSASGQSLASGGTRSHSISMNTSSVTYSVAVSNPTGYTASVSPTSASIPVGGSRTFTISCTPTVYTATLTIDADASTNYIIQNSSGQTLVDDFVAWDGTNTHTVTLSGASETLSVIPDNYDGYRFEVSNSNSSSLDGVFSVDGGDQVDVYIDRKGLAGSCDFTGTSGGVTGDTLTVDSGDSVTLSWSGENLSFVTAQDDSPSDGVWGTKAVSTQGGSETITMPTVGAGQSVTREYRLLCGYRDNTRETFYVSVTAQGESLPTTIEVTSDKATTFSVIPDYSGGDLTNISISAGEVYPVDFAGSDSGTIYTITQTTDYPGFTKSITATVNGSYAGSSSATAANGQTLRYTLTYTENTLPTVTISANPTSLSAPGNTTLTWSSTDATSCEASGDWGGNKTTSGSQTVGVGGDSKTYILTCVNQYGEGEDFVTVSVDEELSVSITADSDEVPANGSVDLTWSSTAAENCWAQGSWSGDKDTSGVETINGSGSGYYNFYLYCSDSEDNTENDVATVYFYQVTECNDGIDNDGDGQADLADNGCDSGSDNSESSSECSDGIDNDGDGDIDLSDSSCSSSLDDDELNPQPQYSMTVSPSSITLGATEPQSGQANILITSIDGYSENVSITASFVGEAPSGTTLVYSDNIQAGSSGSLYVEASEPLEPAEYTIQITSTGQMQDGSDLVINRYVTLEVEGGDDARFEEF